MVFIMPSYEYDFEKDKERRAPSDLDLAILDHKSVGR